MPSQKNGLILGIDPGLARTGFALFAEPNLVLSCSTVVTIPGTASSFSEKSGTKKLWITSSERSLNTTGRSFARYSWGETTVLPPGRGYENSNAN